MKLTIDFETRSACDIKAHGAAVYSEHPTTEVLCLSVKRHGMSPSITRPKEKDVLDVANFVSRSTMVDIIEAHNVSFEHLIWTNVCMKKYGWPPLPLEKLRCSAAKAAMYSLPRSLDGACRALNLPIQKDQEGYRIMMKVCRPRKPRKNEDPVNPDDPYGFYWNEEPEDLERLYQYCMNDTVAEECLSDCLPDLPESELRIWQLDQIINNRGIGVDLNAARCMLGMVEEHEALLLGELSALTYGEVKTARQLEQLRKHLLGRGVDIPDLMAATVKAALRREDLDAGTRRLLEIRQSLGRSSSAKYRAIIDRASSDGRVRQTQLYHGAGTGRWSGAGIQPQNFPSRIKISDDPEKILECVLYGGLSLVSALYPDDPMAIAGAVTRSAIVAAPGKVLTVADYSAIEGRGLAWLAGEEDELENYRNKLDPYIFSAARILHKSYQEITKDERQSPGKISVLACGYGGSVNAVRKFGGEGMSDKEIKDQIVVPWRDAHPMTVRFWADLESACFNAVSDLGRIYTARSISFRVKNGFLMCRLPSGRILYYYDPRIVIETFILFSDGSYIREGDPSLSDFLLAHPNAAPVRKDQKPQVSYMTVDGMTKKWLRTTTYGGKLAENVTQAICRDIMAEAMLRVEKAGYKIVLTVHDELVSENPEDFGSVEEFEQIMCVPPTWAKGFPIEASGWRGKRYKK